MPGVDSPERRDIDRSQPTEPLSVRPVQAQLIPLKIGEAAVRNISIDRRTVDLREVADERRQARLIRSFRVGVTVVLQLQGVASADAREGVEPVAVLKHERL